MVTDELESVRHTKHDTPKNEISKQVSSNRRGKPRHKRAKNDYKKVRIVEFPSN